jgi:hypothetical protein
MQSQLCITCKAANPCHYPKPCKHGCELAFTCATLRTHHQAPCSVSLAQCWTSTRRLFPWFTSAIPCSTTRVPKQSQAPTITAPIASNATTTLHQLQVCEAMPQPKPASTLTASLLSLALLFERNTMPCVLCKNAEQHRYNLLTWLHVCMSACLHVLAHAPTL